MWKNTDTAFILKGFHGHNEHCGAKIGPEHQNCVDKVKDPCIWGVGAMKIDAGPLGDPQTDVGTVRTSWPFSVVCWTFQFHVAKPHFGRQEKVGHTITFICSIRVCTMRQSTLYRAKTCVCACATTISPIYEACAANPVHENGTSVEL